MMSDGLFDFEELPTSCPHCGRRLVNGNCPWCGPKQGEALKEEGMAKALSKDGLARWKMAFRSEVWHRPAGDLFTSEDITDVIGLPQGGTVMNGNNAVGAIMNGIAKRGLIEKTSQRVKSKHPRSHGAELVVWMRTTNIGER